MSSTIEHADQPAKTLVDLLLAAKSPRDVPAILGVTRNQLRYAGPIRKGECPSSFKWGTAGVGDANGVASFNFSKSPNDAKECLLSDIIETGERDEKRCLTQHGINQLVRKLIASTGPKSKLLNAIMDLPWDARTRPETRKRAARKAPAANLEMGETMPVEAPIANTTTITTAITTIDATLIARINEQHSIASATLRTALLAARECGRLLCIAKRQTPHGDFGAWLKNNFNGSSRAAQTYMRIDRKWDRIPKAQLSADLTIDRALKFFAEPRNRQVEPLSFRLGAPAAKCSTTEPAAEPLTLDAESIAVVEPAPAPMPATLKDALRVHRAKEAATIRDPRCAAIAAQSTDLIDTVRQPQLRDLTEAAVNLARIVGGIIADEAEILRAADSEYWTSAAKTQIRGLFAAVRKDFDHVDRILKGDQ